MPYNDLTEPEAIRVLIGNHEKESKLRARWNNLHENLVNRAATFKRVEKGYTETDVAKVYIEAGLAATTRDHIEAGRNRRRILPDRKLFPTKEDLRNDHSITNLGLGDPKEDPRLDRPKDDLIGEPFMRPVPSEEIEFIYKGLPGLARLEYLKKRNETKPEEKYYFEVTTSHDYGWRLKDSPFGKNVPKYPRLTTMKECLNSRTGMSPDPDHYKSSYAILQNEPCSSEI
ncbi:hypothetical protein NE865_09494 [Phthorimaea operculella]|nr:hypothetical protein NE865_09494 [Phthorimaea operculella]